MTHRDFVYWLQGFLEVSDPKWIGEKETEMIKRHLALCFEKKTEPFEKPSVHNLGDVYFPHLKDAPLPLGTFC